MTTLIGSFVSGTSAFAILFIPKHIRKSANINDEVVLLGNSENNELKITVFDIAKWNKTIEWEILTNINERLERVEIE